MTVDDVGGFERSIPHLAAEDEDIVELEEGGFSFSFPENTVHKSAVGIEEFRHGLCVERRNRRDTFGAEFAAAVGPEHDRLFELGGPGLDKFAVGGSFGSVAAGGLINQ